MDRFFFCEKKQGLFYNFFFGKISKINVIIEDLSKAFL